MALYRPVCGKLTRWDLQMPVFKDFSEQHEALGIGRRIRHIRKQKGWVLQELASKLDMSPATLSNIETDKLVLDLDRLAALSEALGIAPDQLVPPTDSRHFEIVRRNGAVRTDVRLVGAKTDDRPGAYHNLVHPLAHAFVGKHIEPFHIQVSRVDDAEVSLINHGHEEFFFVLRGEVECLLQTPEGMVRPVLGEGDSMYFWSHLPHCIRSTTSTPADTIHVLCAAQADQSHEELNDSMAIVSQASPLTLSERFADRVRSLRRASGMALEPFAAEIGVGARRLAEIERGRKPIPIDLALKVCRRFRKPLEFFLAGAVVAKPYYFVQRASEIANVPARTRREPTDQAPATAITFKPLASGFLNRSIHPYYVQLPEIETGQPTIREHNGQVFVYVLNGGVKLLTVLAGRPVAETLSAGDSCFIDATVPHRFVGAGLNPFEPRNAEIISVFWCPLGERYLFDDDGERPGAQSR